MLYFEPNHSHASSIDIFSDLEEAKLSFERLKDILLYI